MSYRSKKNKYNYRNKSNSDFYKSFKHYQNLNNSIPQFILEKLQNMPNNKGYIWKGIYCFGELPPDSLEKYCMFEKYRDLLIIHEWNSKEYKIWHKEGKSKKVLHSIKQRKIKELEYINK
jgi:hypothetical protein